MTALTDKVRHYEERLKAIPGDIESVHTEIAEYSANRLREVDVYEEEKARIEAELPDLEKAVILEAHDIRHALATVEQAEEAGLDLAIACALVEKESGGGHNVYGHDIDPDTGLPVWHGDPGRVLVTPENYAEYLKFRNRTGKVQGVGPTQLTSKGLQDQADKLGGAWNFRSNMLVGFRSMRKRIKDKGLHAGLASYNGSGPAAEAYADDMERRIKRWEERLA